MTTTLTTEARKIRYRDLMKRSHLRLLEMIVDRYTYHTKLGGIACIAFFNDLRIYNLYEATLYLLEDLRHVGLNTEANDLISEINKFVEDTNHGK